MAHPRLTATVVSLTAGLLVLAMAPKVVRLEQADRWWFGMVSGTEGLVAGKGTEEDPRRLEVIDAPEGMAPGGVLFLDEDPEEYFEEVPPVPTDLAVMMARLKKAGVEGVGIGYPLSWDEPDVLAVEAMRSTFDRLDALVMGFELVNATSDQPVAVPFQYCSISYAEVVGDRSKLPVVNALPGALPEFGGDDSLAGFTVLGSEEQESGRAYLLARWDDRVVFALPLAMEIARRGIDPAEVVVVAGEEIRVGEEGPRIPIDFRGRVRLPEVEPEVQRVNATAIIRRVLPQDFGKEAPVYLIDARLSGGKFEREWGELLPRIDATVRGAPRRVGMTEVPRPNPIGELMGLVVLACVVGWSLKGGSVLKRLALATGWCAAVAILLAILIRGPGVAPLVLAYQIVPVAALLTVLFTESASRVAVTSSKEIEAQMEESKRSATKKSGKKAKRRRKRQ